MSLARWLRSAECGVGALLVLAFCLGIVIANLATWRAS